MGAALNDTPLFQYHDAVGITHGRQSMGNYKCGAAFHQRIHTALYQAFGTGIDGGCGFVQNQYRRVSHGHAGNGQQLPLTLTEVCAVAGELGVIALGQTGDEVVGIGQFCGTDAFLVGGIQLAVADVLHNGAGEQVGFLEHHTQRTAQVRFLDLVDVDVVVADLAVVDVVEAVDQVGNGEVGGQAVLGRQDLITTPWLTERHGYDPTSSPTSLTVSTTLTTAKSATTTSTSTRSKRKSEAKRS